MKKIKQLFITIFFFGVLSATFCETIEYHTTVENVKSFITNLKGEGPFKVVVSGKMKSYTTYAIKTALHKNPTVNVELDLSNVKDMTYVDKLDFSYCTNLVAIILPDTIEYIGESAFSGCSNLKKIRIPERVTNISVQAFSKCTSLTSIVIPENVTRISSSAFGWCRQLETVSGKIELENGITIINSYAFSNCDLEEIIIPEGVKVIGFGAFDGCDKLKKITLPKSIEEISLFAFSDCPNLTSINYKGTQDQWEKINKKFPIPTNINFVSDNVY